MVRIAAGAIGLSARVCDAKDNLASILHRSEFCFEIEGMFPINKAYLISKLAILLCGAA